MKHNSKKSDNRVHKVACHKKKKKKLEVKQHLHCYSCTRQHAIDNGREGN